MLEIACRKCHQWIMDYQKDGPGRLLRCYVDRIYHPSKMRNIKFKKRTLRNEENLSCPKCYAEVAVPIIYQRNYPEPEKRSAFLILKDNINGKYQPCIEFKERTD